MRRHVIVTPVAAASDQQIFLFSQILGVPFATKPTDKEFAKNTQPCVLIYTQDFTLQSSSSVIIIFIVEFQRDSYYYSHTVFSHYFSLLAKSEGL